MATYISHELPVVINWEAIIRRFNNKTHPYKIYIEELVHELSHTIDCKTFDIVDEEIGNQIQINDLIENKYPSLYNRDKAEIRVLAATFLVLEKLGLGNEPDNSLKKIYHEMHTNLKHETYIRDRDKTAAEFIKNLTSRRTIGLYNKVMKFLNQYIVVN